MSVGMIRGAPGSQRKIGDFGPAISHMSRPAMYVPPWASHICLAVRWFVGLGLHVVPAYVPPAASHILVEPSWTEVEQPASGSAASPTSIRMPRAFPLAIVSSVRRYRSAAMVKLSKTVQPRAVTAL